MQRVSSRGNPYHDELGRFSSADKSKLKSEKSERQYNAQSENRRIASKCTFTPAKTKEEAANFAKSLGVDLDTDCFTLEQCNDINRVTEETVVEFPKTNGYIKKISSTEHYYAVEREENIKKIEEHYAKKGIPKGAAKKLAEIEYNFFSKLGSTSLVVMSDFEDGSMYISTNRSVNIPFITNTYNDSFEARVYHEYGHVIALKYSPDLGKSVYDKFGKTKIRIGLSEYAATSSEELIAEGWTECKTGKKPRNIALTVGEYLRGLK